jgi:membrane-associated protein
MQGIEPAWVEPRGMLSHLIAPLLHLRGPLAYLLVGALAFGEAAIMLGFVLPGETAVLLGGVLASQGRVSLEGMAVVAALSAVVGDSVGYEVGRHFGERVLRWRVMRRPRARLGVAKATDFLRRRGGAAVFFGRFVAFFRAVIPGLAGMSEMPYRRFLLFNAAGGILWAVGYTLLGDAVGLSYAAAEHDANVATGVVVACLVVAFVLYSVLRRRREQAEAAKLGFTGEGPVGPSGAGSEDRVADLGRTAGGGDRRQPPA